MMSKLLPATTAAVMIFVASCGTWVGNPKPDDDDDDDPSTTPITETNGGGGGFGPGKQSTVVAGPGETLLQKLTLAAGSTLSNDLSLQPSVAFPLLQTSGGHPIEISLTGPDGFEVAYDRTAVDGAALRFAVAEGGDYVFSAKNNSMVATSASTVVSGAEAVGDLFNSTRAEGPYKDVLLKAFVSFAKDCFDGNPTPVKHTASGNRYYPQPFVFLGTVDGNKRVTPIKSAKITLTYGSQTVALKRIDDLPPAAVRIQQLAFSADEQLAYTKAYYQGYFGGAGQLYTVDTFFWGGDCVASPTFDLGTDVGTAEVIMHVADSSHFPAIDAKVAIRPTLHTKFRTYAANDTELLNYAQCTIDPLTGAPKPYGGSGPCSSLSLSNPPYVKLESAMPSANKGAGYTAASDPTRIVYYGSSESRKWWNAMLARRDEILANASGTTVVSIDGCWRKGGLTAVPLVAAKTLLPMDEFRFEKDDVALLAHSDGSYTSLSEFFQGDIDSSGDLTLKKCIPSSTSSCSTARNVTIRSSGCTMKADSGVTVRSVRERMVYPDEMEVTGVIAD